MDIRAMVADYVKNFGMSCAVDVRRSRFRPIADVVRLGSAQIQTANRRNYRNRFDVGVLRWQRARNKIENSRRSLFLRLRVAASAGDQDCVNAIQSTEWK